MSGLNEKIRVLIVDDSAMIRRVIAMGIEQDNQLEVVGYATNGEQARDMLERLRPDVITLDLEMPNMDGLTFMRTYMRRNPIPTVVISSTTNVNSRATIQAMEAGAVDIIAKPSIGTTAGLASMMQDICVRIRQAASAKPGTTRPSVLVTTSTSTGISLPNRVPHSWVFAIGSSTGGIQALTRILPFFPAESPGIVICQHMPEGFTHSFATRLDSICQMRVNEARDGDLVQKGQILIAPGGDKHMKLVRVQTGYRVQLVNGDPVCYSRPSVDVLFESVAKEAGRFCSAAILTGMGRDGAQGMLSIRQKGGRTFAQNEKTCVVYGMPQAAAQIGAAEGVLPLDDIPQAMIEVISATPARSNPSLT